MFPVPIQHQYKRIISLTIYALSLVATQLLQLDPTKSQQLIRLSASILNGTPWHQTSVLFRAPYLQGKIQAIFTWLHLYHLKQGSKHITWA